MLTGKKNYLPLYILFSLGLMVTGYLLSPYGRVNNLYVSGDTMVPEQSIMTASAITGKQTVIGTLANQGDIEKNIKTLLPQIKKVDLKWQDVHDVRIEVEDFSTIAYLDNGKTYQNVLENGAILLEGTEIPLGNKPLLKQFEAGPLLNTFVTEYSHVSDEIQNSISEIHYMGSTVNPYSVVFLMNDGNKIQANVNDFAEKIIYYPEILQELEGKKGTVNMEVGVFFTPFEPEKE